MTRTLLSASLVPFAPLALAPLALAACGQPDPGSAAVANAAADTGYIGKVQALPPRQREGVLFRAIQSGGGPNCQGIAKVDPQPATKAGQPVWLVTCSEGSQWLIALADDGTATVTGARDTPTGLSQRPATRLP